MGETMRTNKSIAWTIIVSVTLLALLALSFGVPTSSTAAPAAAPTPVSVTRPGNGVAPEFPVFFNGTSGITADTRSSCFEVPEYSAVDLQYLIDQSDVNTMTVKLQFSNDLVTFADGATVLTDNAADASGMQQFALYGRYACVYADVITSTFPVTLTVIGVVK
jgi:hypothetical protein